MIVLYNFMIENKYVILLESLIVRSFYCLYIKIASHLSRHLDFLFYFIFLIQSINQSIRPREKWDFDENPKIIMIGVWSRSIFSACHWGRVLCVARPRRLVLWPHSVWDLVSDRSQWSWWLEVLPHFSHLSPWLLWEFSSCLCPLALSALQQDSPRLLLVGDFCHWRCPIPSFQKEAFCIGMILCGMYDLVAFRYRNGFDSWIQISYCLSLYEKDEWGEKSGSEWKRGYVD